MFDPSIDEIIKAIDSQRDTAQGKEITVVLISLVYSSGADIHPCRLTALLVVSQRTNTFSLG